MPESMVVRSPEPLRMIAKNRLGGIVVPFAGPEDDSYRTYWDRNTDFATDMFAPQPVFVLHNLKPGMWGRSGSALNFALHEEGLYASLDLEWPNASVLQQHIRSLADRGRAAATTGTMPHLIEADQKTGYISRWPIVEVSIGDVSEVSAAPGLTHMDYQRAGKELAGDLPDNLSFVRSVWTGVTIMPENNGTGQQPTTTPPPAPAPVPAPAVDLVPVMDALRGISTRLEALENPEPPTKKTSGGDNPVNQPNIRVASKFDGSHISLMDLLLFDHLNSLRAASESTRTSGFKYQRSNEFIRAVLARTKKLYDAEEAIGNQPSEIVEGVHSVPLRAIDSEAYQSWHNRVPYLRADEAMMSDLTNYGDELVPTLLNSMVYHFFRMQSRVFGLFDMFDMPSEPYDWPTVTSGPTLRLVQELQHRSQFSLPSATTPDSKVGTDKITFATKKIGAMTLASEELFQDSGVNVMSAFTEQYMAANTAGLDDVLLNGDESATATNISHYGTDPTGTVYDRYLAMDGLRHMAVTDSNTAATATIGADSIVSLQKKLGTRGIRGLDIGNVVAIIDPGTAYAFIELDALESLADMGQQATLLTGQVRQVKGVPLVVSDELEYANASGQVEDSHDGTKGQQVVVHRPSIKIGRRRGTAIDSEHFRWADGFAIWSFFKLDIQEMETKSVAQGYNSTV